jgi:hypothetical protein
LDKLGENMRLVEYRETLSPGQSLVCAQCLCEASKSEASKNGLKAVRTAFTRKIVEFWGEAIPEYHIFAHGGEEE